MNINSLHKKEVDLLQKIRPHALITTNYDRLLEVIFPEYEPIVGQKIIQGTPAAIGEIFKIHGCVSSADSMVFTTSDYQAFMKKKKYLSAKMLTYFSEHPLIFIGYGAGDPNIQAILSDIDEALPISGGVISNVFILDRRSPTNEDNYPAREKLIPIEETRSVRVNLIEADAFGWVFEAFGSQPNISNISPKLLRALFVRSYDLVRLDVPKTKFEVNFKTLEGAVASSESFAQLLGITTVDEATSHAANYPYTLTQLAIKLGFKQWNDIDWVRKKILTDTGNKISGKDNKYHSAIMYGKGQVHKYSEHAVILFRKIIGGQPYEY